MAWYDDFITFWQEKQDTDTSSQTERYRNYAQSEQFWRPMRNLVSDPKPNYVKYHEEKLYMHKHNGSVIVENPSNNVTVRLRVNKKRKSRDGWGNWSSFGNNTSFINLKPRASEKVSNTWKRGKTDEEVHITVEGTQYKRTLEEVYDEYEKLDDDDIGVIVNYNEGENMDDEEAFGDEGINQPPEPPIPPPPSPNESFVSKYFTKNEISPDGFVEKKPNWMVILAVIALPIILIGGAIMFLGKRKEERRY